MARAGLGAARRTAHASRFITQPMALAIEQIDDAQRALVEGARRQLAGCGGIDQKAHRRQRLAGGAGGNRVTISAGARFTERNTPLRMRRFCMSGVSMQSGTLAASAQVRVL